MATMAPSTTTLAAATSSSSPLSQHSTRKRKQSSCTKQLPQEDSTTDVQEEPPTTPRRWKALKRVVVMRKEKKPASSSVTEKPASSLTTAKVSTATKDKLERSVSTGKQVQAAAVSSHAVKTEPSNTNNNNSKDVVVVVKRKKTTTKHTTHNNNNPKSPPLRGRRGPSEEEWEKCKDRPRFQRALETWYYRYNQLADYARKHGNCNVPQKYKPCKELGIWVNKMREEKKRYDDGQRSALDSHKIKALADIGFQWSKKKGDELWEKRFLELIAFREKYGRDPGTKVSGIGRWVSTQRCHYKQNLLPADRVARLETVGFRFNAKDDEDSLASPSAHSETQTSVTGYQAGRPGDMVATPLQRNTEGNRQKLKYGHGNTTMTNNAATDGLEQRMNTGAYAPIAPRNATPVGLYVTAQSSGHDHARLQPYQQDEMWVAPAESATVSATENGYQWKNGDEKKVETDPPHDCMTTEEPTDETDGVASQFIGEDEECETEEETIVI